MKSHMMASTSVDFPKRSTTAAYLTSPPLQQTVIKRSSVSRIAEQQCTRRQEQSRSQSLVLHSATHVEATYTQMCLTFGVKMLAMHARTLLDHLEQSCERLAPVTFPVWPSKLWMGVALPELTSYILTEGLPAAANNCLSAVISNLLTWTPS